MGSNIPGTNVRVEKHYVHAIPNNAIRQDTTSFPFNTDGFNLGGHNITIDGYTGWNGDDCVSVVNEQLLWLLSRGLSIGSLGKNGAASTVAKVLFKNWAMEGIMYGARFKSWTGGNGWAENITWRDVTVRNVSMPIYITQNSYDREVGKPENLGRDSTTISNPRVKNSFGFLNGNWTDGTCINEPCWDCVQGTDGTQSVIMDLYSDTAFTFMNITIDPPNQSDVEAANVPCAPQALEPGEQDTLGFNCTNDSCGAIEIKGSNSNQPSGVASITVPALPAAIMAVAIAALGL